MKLTMPVRSPLIIYVWDDLNEVRQRRGELARDSVKGSGLIKGVVALRG